MKKLLNALLLIAAVGCSSSSTGGADGGGGTGGGNATDGGAGPVPGPADMHCAGKDPQPVDPKVCQAPAPDGGAEGDAGMEPEPATLYNAEGDDDDCKYHLTFSSDPIVENKLVYFTVTVKQKSNGMPETGGAFAIEAHLGDTHPAPDISPAPKATESPPGTFKFPVKFDMPGRWTVKFHIHEDCLDNDEASQHGHASFFINVP